MTQIFTPSHIEVAKVIQKRAKEIVRPINVVTVVVGQFPFMPVLCAVVPGVRWKICEHSKFRCADWKNDGSDVDLATIVG